MRTWKRTARCEVRRGSRSARLAWVLAAVGVLPTALPSLAQSYTPTTPTTTVSSSGISSQRPEEVQVQLAWLADPWTFPWQLSARLTPSGLQVLGSVPTPAIKQRALQVAHATCRMPVIDGVRLQSGLSLPFVNSRPEAELQAAAEELLRKRFGAAAGDVQVQVQDNGAVVVVGRVPSAEQRLAVSQCFRGLDGCRSVVSRLDVGGSRDVQPTTALSYRKPAPTPARPTVEVATKPTPPTPGSTVEVAAQPAPLPPALTTASTPDVAPPPLPLPTPTVATSTPAPETPTLPTIQNGSAPSPTVVVVTPPPPAPTPVLEAPPSPTFTPPPTESPKVVADAPKPNPAPTILDLSGTPAPTASSCDCNDKTPGEKCSAPQPQAVVLANYSKPANNDASITESKSVVTTGLVSWDIPELKTIHEAVATVCGDAVEDLSVDLKGRRELLVRVKMKQSEEWPALRKRIAELPHLAYYVVSFSEK